MSPPPGKFSKLLNNKNLSWTKVLFLFLFFHTVHAHENPPNLTLLVQCYIKLNQMGNLTQNSLTHGKNTISPVPSLSHVWLFATPWTAACQASLSPVPLCVSPSDFLDDPYLAFHIHRISRKGFWGSLWSSSFFYIPKPEGSKTVLTFWRIPF